MPTSSRGNARRALKVVATVLVVGGGIGIASTLHRIDWATFGSAFAHVSLLPFAIALSVSTLQVFAQLARFAVILPRAARAPLRELLEVTAVGQLLNYTTPLRAGDAYKLARLSSSAEPEKGRFATLAAALALERVADVGTLLLVTAATTTSWITTMNVSAPTRTAALGAALAVALGALGVSLVVHLAPGVLHRFARGAWRLWHRPRLLGASSSRLRPGSSMRERCTGRLGLRDVRLPSVPRCLASSC